MLVWTNQTPLMVLAGTCNTEALSFACSVTFTSIDAPCASSTSTSDTVTLFKRRVPPSTTANRLPARNTTVGGSFTGRTTTMTFSVTFFELNAPPLLPLPRSSTKKEM